MTQGRSTPAERARRTRLVGRMFELPAYPPSAADLRTVRIAGMDLPLRATVAVVVVVFAILFDYSRTFMPESLQELGRAPEAQRAQAIQRAVLFGLVPLLVVVAAFRDRPSRYGLALGDWRWGLPLALVGGLLMTPIVLGVAGLPDFRAYYAVSSTNLADLLVTNAADLVSSEFLHRGLLLFALVRAIGPFGLLVATVPFVFAHLGKPEAELFSTLGGGLVFGWLNLRTGSIVWSAAAHVYVLTLVLVATRA